MSDQVLLKEAYCNYNVNINACFLMPRVILHLSETSCDV